MAKDKLELITKDRLIKIHTSLYEDDDPDFSAFDEATHVIMNTLFEYFELKKENKELKQNIKHLQICLNRKE
jgi:hypothetical protein